MVDKKVTKPEAEIVEVYVVKYWETQGVFRMRAEILGDGKYARQDKSTVGLHCVPVFVSRRDYALTEEEARKRVGELLASKIKSLETKLKALKALDPKTMPFAGAKGG